MSESVREQKPLESRVEELERRFDELRSYLLGCPSGPAAQKDWRRTVGTFPRDEFTIEAERLGREWRERANAED